MRPILSVLLLSACARPPAVSEPPARVRNVILIIGDGMGPQQVGLLDLYARRAPGSPYRGATPAVLRMAEAGVVGLSATDPHDGLVVDSACSATQLALGLPALSEVIGVDTSGDPRPTILERAEAAGLWTGLVSDTRLTHATPAAFAAHQPHRSLEDAIASQMIASGAEVLLSGGLRYFAPANPDVLARHGVPFTLARGRADGADLLTEAEERGFRLAFDRAGLDAATRAGGPILGLFTPSGMMDGIAATATRDDPARTEPSLREMTQAALSVLERSPQGFFLMVESGQIDWACHSNDAGWLLHEMLKLDDTVDAVLSWATDRDDTLVVLTADHETGGFGLSYSMYDPPAPRPLPGSAFAGRDYLPGSDFGRPERLDAMAAQGLTLSQLLDLPSSGDPAELVRLTREHTRFPLTLAQAEAVLQTRDNPYHDAERRPKAPAIMADIRDFPAFYPAGLGARSAVLARQIADQQGVVWSTGTHTHTPVPVFALGPPRVARDFGGWRHHVELGERLQRALLGAPER